MHITITCGPSFEPVDYVRRLTNFSTGELGLMLAATMDMAGYRVSCFKGEGCTHATGATSMGVETHTFTTNEDLVAKLAAHARTSISDVFFHIAALSDFRIKRLQDEAGNELLKGKISSATRGLTIHLEPAVKIISLLPKLFPNTRIVGWKYEVEGSREEVLAKAARQMESSTNVACVVNGPAWGKGFGVVRKDQSITELDSKRDLCDYLVQEVQNLR